MRVDDLVANHPRIFHVADARALPSIQALGLLTTSTLMHLYGARSRPPAAGPRGSAMVLTHPAGAMVAVIRDQRSLKFLPRVMDEETTPEEYLATLDNRCFFWATEGRLERLLRGRMYRSTPQVIFTVDTASLVEAHADAIELSPYYSGSAPLPTSPIRGRGTFQPIADYDYATWRQARGRAGDALVEVTVTRNIPDFERYVRAVRHHPGDGVPAA